MTRRGYRDSREVATALAISPRLCIIYESWREKGATMAETANLSVRMRGLPKYEPVAEGYAIPRNIITVSASWPDRAVEVDVEVIGGRARTRRLTVSTDQPEGVGSTMLREVPIRDVVASGLRALLARVEFKGTSAKIAPIRDDQFDEADLAALKKLVGYDPDVIEGEVEVKW
jgi:hypothetical protein